MIGCDLSTDGIAVVGGLAVQILVPVVVLDHLSETQRRAYIIADNRLAMNAGRDEKVLVSEPRELETEGMDLALMGFSDAELESLRAENEAPPPEVQHDSPGAIGATGIRFARYSAMSAPMWSSRRRPTRRSASTTPPATSNRSLRTSMWTGTARSRPESSRF